MSGRSIQQRGFLASGTPPKRPRKNITSSAMSATREVNYWQRRAYEWLKRLGDRTKQVESEAVFGGI